jgi:hypothetical protein
MLSSIQNPLKSFMIIVLAVIEKPVIADEKLVKMDIENRALLGHVT